MFKGPAHLPCSTADFQDPKNLALRRQILRNKPFLHRLYEEWYAAVAAALPPGEEPVLEIGCGPGFLRDFISDLIVSEAFWAPGIHLALDAHALPFLNGTLRAVVMTDVFHHLPRPRRFFREASRCIRLGGRIVMLEPWVTPWSRLVYGRFHHEPFRPDAKEWDFPLKGPLSGANAALPWVVLERDRSEFERAFPEWQIDSIKPIMPFRYLLSGGMSVPTLMPACTLTLWGRMEEVLKPWMKHLAMFALIVLVKK